MAQPEFYSGKTLYPVIAALIALSALFGLVVMPRLSPPGDGLVGKAAPEFTLPVVANGDSGARIKLSELRDKVIVLDFWASWCGPCAVQAPILDRIARKYPDRVVVLGINTSDSPARARAYAKSKGLSYPILSDTEGKVQLAYRADTLPTIVLVDQQGNTSAFTKGLIPQAKLERAIRNHL